ncbi:4-hydroxyphenylpyruvate dioxygenase [Myxococcus sp. CA051A]|uniref:4-hydroxyphenylpyruvate dioxygenase n=1 Tax=unclassified Myxococcus TaxID=2648731 RepID=UPI00157AE5A2|nr:MULTISPECIES: 4-hydroxyphenylpyruvate dioxygenase [unclassified Myxococcus]NTX32876.1 4-hydroxyphenylpyruvate dioxygenase [Myxococcus sp. CA033]NTX60058.1 4-hydroxyphenylpyruvate dioxygenase [Myxococcus sp. CA051A]
MMSTAENPLGLNGFEFVEFTSPAPEAMVKLVEMLGFTAFSKHPSKDLVRYKQGDINLLISRETTGQAAEFRAAHGPSANAMAFRVANARTAYEMALERGAIPADPAASSLGEGFYVLQGIGGSLLYLIDRHGPSGTIYDSWTQIPGAVEAEARNSVGLESLDHLTHNVRRGEMRTWSSFYNRIFGFTEQKYFDIKGQATGLFSQAMIAPDRAIRIPLNESQDEKSQIEEFIREYKGEGIQHLALATQDIYSTVEKLRARGVDLQDTIETYYDLVDSRVPNHGEDLERMRKNRILIDGNQQEGLLLQIFTENLFGPIFFEIIQRKGNEGFGNGNFQALFESIELDQIRRGVIKVDKTRK